MIGLAGHMVQPLEAKMKRGVRPIIRTLRKPKKAGFEQGADQQGKVPIVDTSLKPIEFMPVRV